MALRDRFFGVMPVHIGRDPSEMAEAAAGRAAEILSDVIAARGGTDVMFATGNSQIAFLDALGRERSVDWAAVRVFHMDEYVGLGDTHPASFARYIRERIAEPMAPGEVHYLRGDTGDADAEARRYADLLARHPLDLCCLGIGENGHLAFNDPPVADFTDPLEVKVVHLDKACRLQQVGEGHFPDVGSVPARAITVTVPALLSAGRVLAVVPEARKAEPVRQALEGPVSTSCPASVLRTRPNVELYLDEDSAALLS